jgi:transcriptional regulator with PAS, ATPase and Fis domain
MKLRVLLLDDYPTEACEVVLTALCDFLPSDFDYAAPSMQSGKGIPGSDLQLDGILDEPVILELRQNPTDQRSIHKVLQWLKTSVIDSSEDFDLVLIDDNWGGGESAYAGQKEILPFLFEELTEQTRFCLFTQHYDEDDRTKGLASLLVQEPYRGTTRVSGLSKSDKGGFLILIYTLIGLRELEDARRANDELREQLEKAITKDLGFIAESNAMKKTVEMAKNAAGLKTILITGETGSGKEIMARFIHSVSARSSSPFVAVNCASLSEGTLESELFGHVKGAFTGAIADRKGRFEFAHKGAFLLDEVGDLSMNTQIKLLRVLEDHKIERVGDNRSIPIDVQVIAATHRNLQNLVKNGDFREDLFYRLNVFHVELPSLRERLEDIPLLVEHFLAKYKHEHQKPHVEGITPEVLDIFINHYWPGNIRELENCIASALAVCDDSLISRRHLPSTVAITKITSQPVPWSIHDFERTGRISQFDKGYFILNYLLERPNTAVPASELMTYINGSEELSDIRSSRGWNPYRSKGALREAIHRLREKFNGSEIVRESNVKLMERGCGVLIIG